MDIHSTDALIVVDMQNDFLPGGTLPVTGGDTIIPVINKLIINFDHVIFTRDWHPDNHISFSGNPDFTGGSWPRHCVQGTPGAAFHQDLNQGSASLIVSKATIPDKEAYSGFQDTMLAGWLSDRQINRVFICGVATDYCVLNTALDARRLTLETWVVNDAIRGVDNPAGTVNKAIRTMEDQQIKFIASSQLVRP